MTPSSAPQDAGTHRRDVLARALYPAVAAAVYLMLCAAIFHVIRHNQDGHFTFSLDDPYIHLALSEQIAHGHYGINVGENASPASSIVWPFLIAPFAASASQPLFVLGLNLIFGLLAALLLGCAVTAWPQDDGSRDETLRRALTAATLVVTANLVGLTFIGMEHTLQVLLAAGCAWGIVACLRGREIPVWCLACAALGPAVRYEALGLSLALALALYGQGRTRRALALFAVSLLPVLGFSVFLHHLGLPLLPTSVMVKGSVAEHSSLLHRVWTILLEPQMHVVRDRHRLVLVILFLTLAGLAWNTPQRVRRFALAGAAAAAGLHLLIGRLNWFFRYEAYIVVFSVVVILYVLHERPRIMLGWYALGLLGCSFLNLDALDLTTVNARAVYLQQFQMHRFATDYFQGNVAVNDLGLVSYRRRPDEYVLDLFGLGSVETAQQTNKSPQWLDAVTRRHNVGLVMIYPHWFRSVPADWVPLGELCNAVHANLGGDCVDYFATPLAPPDTKARFDAFVHTLPAYVELRPAMTLDRPFER